MAASLALLVASAPATAAPKRITGKLSKPGYTVIALAANGKASLDRPRRRKFSLRPPAQKVTLHLRSPGGTYAGPIVVRKRRNGGRAIVGVKAGAKLRKVIVKSAKGFAKVRRKLPRRQIDRRREARAKRGIPIGAGNFGRVRSRKATGAPGDLDRDGIADPLDVDDDGDLILDNLDRRVGRAGARASQTEGSGGFFIGTSVDVPIEQSANHNVGATDAEIDAALPAWGALTVRVLPFVPLSDHPGELDCGGAADSDNPNGWLGGLRYCTRGGTATSPHSTEPGSDPPPFPECCDPDGDGYATIAQLPTASPGFFGLLHGATSAEIRTGDVLIQHVATSGDEYECPPAPGTPPEACTEFTSTLPFVFATAPALVSYHDTAGHSGTVTYPVGGPGGSANEFPVGRDPVTGEVMVTVAFYRPQRRPIPDEECPPPEGRLCDPEKDWIDIGGLTYGANIANLEGTGGGGGVCPPGAFGEDDPDLTVKPPSGAEMEAGGVLDGSRDQPASQQNTLTYTVNLTRCLMGPTWSPGQAAGVTFTAIADTAAGSAGTAQGGVRFTLEG